MSTEGISPCENEYLHCHAEKNPNNAGNEGRVASLSLQKVLIKFIVLWLH